jgi:hypothetical protein
MQLGGNILEFEQLIVLVFRYISLCLFSCPKDFVVIHVRNVCEISANTCNRRADSERRR